MSSYPTYEEWKQTNKSKNTHPSEQSSYPTYEEWKQPFSDFSYVILKFLVLILPMRNGNYEMGARSLGDLKEFLSYLWGMETWIILKICLRW